MGFWGKFTDIWKNHWDWKGVTDSFNGAVNSGEGMGKSLVGGLWNTIAGGVTLDGDQFSKGLKGFVDFGKNTVGFGANAIALPFSVPVLRQTAETLGFAQNELVKRPIGAFALMDADSMNDDHNTDWGKFTTWDRWKRSYNDTEKVSAGQALVYDFQRNFNDKAVDPRVDSQYFHNDATAKYSSGTIDLLLDIFADPTLAGGKVAKLGKLKYLSKPMTDVAIAKGADQAYLSSKRADEVFNFYRDEATNQDHALQTLFHRTPGGGTANGVLWDASHIDDPARARAVFNDALLAMWGDNSAHDRLVLAAPEMARSLLAKKKAGRFGAIGQSDFRDPAVRDVLHARRETDAQSLMNAAAQGRGIYGKAYGALIGQNQPRLAMTSKWRVGIHQTFNGDPPVYFGEPFKDAFQKARWMLPSSTTTRIVDFNDADAAHLLRSNWESARVLPAERVAELTARYARATTPESRFRIFNDAENDVFKAIAMNRGFAEKDIDKVMPLVNELRSGNRQSFVGSRRYMSSDVRQMAKQLLDQGDEIGAGRANQLGDEIDQAVRRGDQPHSVIVHYDLDGNPIVMPENFDPAKHPLLQSQTEDMAAAMDWRQLDQALRWHQRGWDKAYKVYDTTRNLADTVNSVWKVGVLLRLATAWRAGSDEVLRAASKFGAAPIMMASANGLVKAASKVTAGSRTLAERVNVARTRRGVNTHNALEGEFEDGAAATDSLAERTHFDGADAQAYRTYEAAVADGALSVPAYVDAVKWHAENTPHELHPDVAQMVQARQDRIITEAELHEHLIEHALAQQGRDMYTAPDWQRAFLDETVNRHAGREIGDDTRPLVTDPLEKRRQQYRVVRHAPAESEFNAANRTRGLSATPINDRWRHKQQVSPYERLGAAHWGYAEPRNPLIVSDDKGGARTWEKALRRLVPDQVDEMLGMDEVALRAKFTKEFPDVDLAQVKDMSDPAMLEAFAAAHARKRGHDAIVNEFKGRPFQSEITGLTEDSMRFGDGIPSVVDPFSGKSPLSQKTDDYALSKTRVLDIHDEMGSLDHYIRTHTDELLKPGQALHSVVLRSGRIQVGIAKAVDAAAELKPTGGRRLLLDRLSDKLTQDAGGLVIHTKHGPVRVDAAFEGGSGARLRAQTSARGPGKSWSERVTDRTYDRMMYATKLAWEDVNPTQAQYAASWERAVNNQIAGDPVARQFLAGHSEHDVLQWLYGTDEGRAYHERMGPYQADPVAQVGSVKKMVDTYVPDTGTAESKLLRRKVLAMKPGQKEGLADFSDLERVLPDIDSRPIIHGSALDMSLGNTFKDKYNNGVNKIFGVLQDMPADHLARFPFVKEAYNRHVEQLVKVMAEREGGNLIPTKMLDRAQEIARDRALADVRKYLYDATTTHDLAKLGRLIVPFGSAAMDSYAKWGTIFKEQPWVAYNLWKAWTAPDRAGLTQDENGNHKTFHNGQERWVQVNPGTSEETLLPGDYKPKNEYIVFQLPKMLQPSIAPGSKATTYINKDTFNTFLSLPTGGPVVAIPASKFAMANPEFADNQFVKKFVLPLGPQANWTDLAVPGYAKTLAGMFSEQDGDLASQQALAIYQTGMVDFSLGKRPKPPTYQEARETASHLRGMRFLYQFLGATPQFKTPYAPYVDAYRQMKAQEREKQKTDPNYDVDVDFYNQFGEEFFYLTSAVTRNRLGVPATISGQRQWQKYKDLIDAHPDLANFIIGAEGSGAFSQAVYQNQLQQAASPGSSEKMRYRMPLKESVEDTAIRLGWVKWGKLMDAVDAEMLDRGLTDINQKGAEDLKGARDRFISNNMVWDESPTGATQLNPWYTEFSTRDNSKMTARLLSMEQVISDPRLSQRDDMQGLSQYLSGRREMAGIMQQNGIKTLNSKKATPYREMWQQFVAGLKDQNLSFASTYNRYLVGDQYLDAKYVDSNS